MTPGFNDLLHLLGPWLTLGLLVIIGLWGIVRNYLFTSAPLNLRSPWEHRVRDRLRDLDERLPLTLDPAIRQLMEQERDRLTLRLVIGMDTTSKYGTEVLGLYQRADSRLSLAELRRASVFLRHRQGKLVKGLDQADQIFGTFLLWGGIVSSGLGWLSLVLLVETALLRHQFAWRTLDSPIWGCVALVLIGWISLFMATPIRHARQLQRWLPDPYQP